MALFGNLMGVLGAALVTTALAGPMAAEELSAPPVLESGNTLVLEALGHSFALPLPDWLSPAERLSGDIIPLISASYRAGANQALFEIYPRGENEEQWTTLYGARVTLEAGRTLTDYRKAVMYGYSGTCKPELTGFFQFGEDDGDTLAPLGFVCGAYLDHLQGYAGQGEVMVTSFHKTEKGVAIVYQEWRGQAFDPSDPKTWPVSAEALKARAEQFKAEARLTLAD